MRPIINTVADITFTRLAEIEKKDWDGSFSDWDYNSVLSLLNNDYDIEEAVEKAGLRGEYEFLIDNDYVDIASLVLSKVEGLKQAA